MHNVLKPRPSPAERAALVDMWRDRSRRLARLSTRLSGEGDIDGALLALESSLDYNRRAEDEINSWSESRRSA